MCVVTKIDIDNGNHQHFQCNSTTWFSAYIYQCKQKLYKINEKIYHLPGQDHDVALPARGTS